MDTSYLSQQVTTIIGQLHNLFDEIGIPHNERDARESDVSLHSRVTILRLTARKALFVPFRDSAKPLATNYDVSSLFW